MKSFVYSAPKIPAPSPHAGEPFDSVLGEGGQWGGKELWFREVIVYNRSQVYPEYIVFYYRHEKEPSKKLAK